MRREIALALKDPKKVAGWLKCTIFKSGERILAKLTESPVERIILFMQEFQQSSLMKYLQYEDRQIRKYAEKGVISSNPNSNLHIAALYYALVRSTKPSTIVETGVANGISSATILFALKQNGTGNLFSIDLPNSSTSESGKPVPYLPEGKEVGWLVPIPLRKNWKLMLGDAKDLLPPLLDELDKIDLFIHDSLHTYEHMLWECRTVWPHLKNDGAFLIADDADWNSAFDDFMQEVGAKAGTFNKNVLFGIAKKYVY
jgi:hypothetical protein